MPLTVDHALFAWPERDAALTACEAVGLSPTFGGVHDGDQTQNDLIAFPDGSYLEVMSPTTPGTEPDRWAGLVDHWRGPEHWCIRADVRGLLTRTIAAGAPVEGPHPGSRDRPDGIRVEWVTGRYGPPDLRGVLPFAIADRTPHRYRVPAAAVADGPLTGIAEVLLGVEALEGPLAWFQRLHDFPRPVDVATPLAAEVVSFPGQPVSFVDPEARSDLASRLEATGPQPLGFLLATDDFDAALRRFALTDPEGWADRRFAWFDADVFRSTVGVLEAA